MFGRIARRYDFFNSVISAGMHGRWRRIAVRHCRFPRGGRALDVAVGTADFAIDTIGEHGTALGVDICEPMLQVGREKLQRMGLDHRILLAVGEAEHLPVPASSFETWTAVRSGAAGGASAAPSA